MIELLINKNVDIRAQDNQNATCLHYAATYLTPDLFESFVNILISNDCMDMFNDQGFCDGVTPLHCALISFEPTEVTMNQIVSFGFNFHAVDNEGNTGLMYDIEGKRSMPLILSLTNLCGWDTTDNDGWTVLHHSTCYGTLSMVKYFIEFEHADKLKYSKSIKGLTPLHTAIQRKINLESDQERSEKIEIIRLLCEAELDLRASDFNNATALHYAASYLTPDMFEYFVELLVPRQCSNVFNMQNRDGKATPLYCAVTHFEPTKKIMELHSAHGFNYDLLDGNGRCLIFNAIYGKRSVSLLQYLVSRCNWKITDDDGCIVMHMAARYGTADAVKYFLGLEETDELKNAKTTNGLTPLLAAFVRNASSDDEERDNMEIIRALRTASVDLEDCSSCSGMPDDDECVAFS